MSEHLCPVCGRGDLRRCGRRGPWERFVLPLFGVFPWRCGRCRIRYRLSDRGEKKPTEKTGTEENGGATQS